MAINIIRPKSKKSTKEQSIKKLLHQHIPSARPVRPKKNVHASELSKPDHAWCPREYALLDITPKSEGTEFIGTSLKTTFDHGIDVQRRINEEYLPTRMVGDWKCRSCGKKAPHCKKPEGQCSNPQAYCNWEYHEVRPISKWNGVSCGLDALVDFKLPKLMIGELKTIKADDFKNMIMPVAEHVSRTSLYLRLVSEWDHPFAEKINTEEARLLYVCKGFGHVDQQVIDWGVKDARFSPYKEFIIHRDDNYLKEEMDRAKVLHHYRETKKGMPCGVCHSINDKRAKSCPVKKECWSGKYPGKVTWLSKGKKYHKDKLILKKDI